MWDRCSLTLRSMELGGCTVVFLVSCGAFHGNNFLRGDSSYFLPTHFHKIHVGTVCGYCLITYSFCCLGRCVHTQEILIKQYVLFSFFSCANLPRRNLEERLSEEFYHTKRHNATLPNKIRRRGKKSSWKKRSRGRRRLKKLVNK